MSKHVFLADNKMANISLDVYVVHSLLKISQNIVSNPHWLHFSLLSVSSIIF